MLCTLALACVWALSPNAAALASPTRVERLIHTALSLDSDARNGAVVYKQHCARCHGVEAAGDVRSAVPALAGQRKAYLVKQLADFTELERDSRAMHAVVARDALSGPQVWADVSRYLSNLPPLQKPEVGSGADTNLGEAIFREQCAACHQDNAEGFAPSLRGQHYSYLLQQLRSLASSHRQNAQDGLGRFLDSLAADELAAVADYLSRDSVPTDP